MRKMLSPIALAVLVTTGCAQKPVVDSYSYESQVHSGTVFVHDLSYGDSDKCPKKWREAEQVFKHGLPPMLGMTLKLKVVAPDANGVERELPLLVSSGNGNLVSLKDYQVDKGLVVNSEVNGAVEQGDLFTYPEGYFIRAAKPEVDSNEFSLCLGIDRMQKSTETDGGAPALDLDRLNVLFEAERGEEKTYVFGRNSDIKVRVSVTPK
ncbi:hypothetical protein SAMN05216178_6833 [Pseudomonas saponiphila]|jgi:hypothetical protein|uniref:Lipoprotein n=1 Tax=Pseudomonas saponiphila TaxID=556534 RepID=A0A1H4ZVT0_9PSED|nr:hypothetical protein [Pseudomonas saponiphila]SED33601.1 hypothetical protein SAMN05216178_6833 [Pseudomonas saponiphila]